MRNMQEFAGEVVLFACTWPYYRTLHQYTLHPIRAIAECHDEATLAQLVQQWRTSKGYEMQFVQIAVSDDSLTSFTLLQHF